MDIQNQQMEEVEINDKPKNKQKVVTMKAHRTTNLEQATPHLKIMSTKTEGGSFDSKLEWIYKKIQHRLSAPSCLVGGARKKRIKHR